MCRGALENAQLMHSQLTANSWCSRICLITPLMESFLAISTGQNCYTWEEVIVGTKTIMIHTMDSKLPVISNLKSGCFDGVIWNDRRGYIIVTAVESFYICGV